MAKKRSGPDLAARFAKCSEVVETAAEKALYEIALKVRDAASKIVSSSQEKRSGAGNLAGSYAVRMRYRGTMPVAVVGTLVKYATYYEFAKSIHGHRYGKELRPPGRALYAALDENKADIEQMIADAVGKGLGAVDVGG